VVANFDSKKWTVDEITGRTARRFGYPEKIAAISSVCVQERLYRDSHSALPPICEGGENAKDSANTGESERDVVPSDCDVQEMRE
jgi:hypothetical protein